MCVRAHVCVRVVFSPLEHYKDRGVNQMLTTSVQKDINSTNRVLSENYSSENEAQ